MVTAFEDCRRRLFDAVVVVVGFVVDVEQEWGQQRPRAHLGTEEMLVEARIVVVTVFDKVAGIGMAEDVVVTLPAVDCWGSSKDIDSYKGTDMHS